MKFNIYVIYIFELCKWKKEYLEEKDKKWY